MKKLVEFVRDEQGTSIFEYAMISAIITLTAMSAIVALGIKFLSVYARG